MPPKLPADPSLTLRLRMALADLHLKSQGLRVARLFAATFISMLLFAPHTDYSGKTLASVAVAAFEAVVRQVWPSLSMKRIVQIITGHFGDITPKADGRPAVPGPSPAAPADPGTASTQDPTIAS